MKTSRMKVSVILTDGQGRPIAKPDPLPRGATYAEWLAHVREMREYHDRVNDAANRVLAEVFRG